MKTQRINTQNVEKAVIGFFTNMAKVWVITFIFLFFIGSAVKSQDFTEPFEIKKISKISYLGDDEIKKFTLPKGEYSCKLAVTGERIDIVPTGFVKTTMSSASHIGDIVLPIEMQVEQGGKVFKVTVPAASTSLVLIQANSDTQIYHFVVRDEGKAITATDNEWTFRLATEEEAGEGHKGLSLFEKGKKNKKWKSYSKNYGEVAHCNVSVFLQKDPAGNVTFIQIGIVRMMYGFPGDASKYNAWQYHEDEMPEDLRKKIEKLKNGYEVH